MKRIHYFTLLVLVALFSGNSEVIAKLAVKPFYQSFDVVAGITMPNLIIVDGVDASIVKLSVTEGPGKFYQRDGLWYWEWDETQRLDGQTYTVSYSASSNDEVVRGQFTVNVRPKWPTSSQIIEPYDSDEGKPVAYTKVLTTVNGYHQFLNGEYRIDVNIDGRPYKSFSSPSCSFRPEFGAMEGMKMDISIYFRSVFMKDFVLLESKSTRIEPPPLNIDLPRRYIANGPSLSSFKCFYGIEGDYSEGPAFLEVQSDGNVYKSFAASRKQRYDEQKTGKLSSFDDEELNVKDDKEVEMNFQKYLADGDKLKWPGDVNYILQLQNAPKNISSEGKDVELVFTDPVTKQSVKKVVRVYP